MNVLVTGSRSGIGLATSIAFAKAGHTVFAAVRDAERIQPLGEVATAENASLSIIELDVTSDSSVQSAMAHIRKQAGPLDVLVNNAGVERLGSVEEMPIAEFRICMETNYFGAIRCIQAALPDMRLGRSGCIVNVSSVGGRISVSPEAAYAASKFALEALAEALAQEVKPFNIRVAIVEPGLINTDMAVRVATPVPGSAYMQCERIPSLFRATLPSATTPLRVAEKILDIAESGTWKLRHTVGDDAEGFLKWRASMSDEEWVTWGALEDRAWRQRIQADFGIDLGQ